MISCIPLRQRRQFYIHIMSNTPASSSSLSLSVIRGTFKRFASAPPSPLLHRRRSTSSAIPFNSPPTMLTYTSILQPEYSSLPSALRLTMGVVDASSAFFSTRRRTRRSSGDHSDGGGQHDASSGGSNSRDSNNTTVIMSMEEFKSAAKSLLDKVEEALVKLKDCNDQLEIVRHPPALSSSTSSSKISTDDSILVDNGSTDGTTLQHGGKLSITVLSSADMYWGGGTYSLTIHTNDEYYDDASSENKSDSSGTTQGGGGGGFITFQSPLSGTYTYIYNVTTREWVGEEDGHSLLGMLTRDWIRQCNGVPDF